MSVAAGSLSLSQTLFQYFTKLWIFLLHVLCRYLSSSYALAGLAKWGHSNTNRDTIVKNALVKTYSVVIYRLAVTKSYGLL